MKAGGIEKVRMHWIFFSYIKSACPKYSPVQRRVLLLRNAVGLSVGEIACQLGKKEKAIESILYRTKTTLREKFGDEWEVE